MAGSARRKPPSRRAAAAARRERGRAARPAKPVKPAVAAEPARRRGGRSGRSGRRVAALLALIILAALPFAALAWADRDGRGRIPEGSRIAGVDVGGLDARTALRRLRARVGIPADRAVRVTVDGTTKANLPADRAGVSLNLARSVRRAVDRGRRGSFVTRGWRRLTGGRLAASQPLRVQVDRRAVSAFVAKLAKQVEVPAESARLRVTVRSVGVAEGQDGKRLAHPDGLTRRIVRSLRDVGSTRRVRARTETVKPPATDRSLWDAHPTVVTVSRAERLARVFERGKVVKTYEVAVGMKRYPTPTGSFAVQTMQKDPVWNVPNAAWAGDLAGKTIPSGDPANPLKARFIGFNGSVGFHGTADLGSLGSAASHGCIRMLPADVKDLFRRVSVGTTVFVG